MTSPGCGSEDDRGDEASLDCESLPACHVEALDTLRECVPAASMLLGPVDVNSGVIEGLTCTAADVSVAFSPFTESESGTVPAPSNVTIQAAGATCASLAVGTGTHTDGESGITTAFVLSAIDVPGRQPATVNRYEDGTVGVQCGPGDEHLATADGLQGCPDAVMFHRVVRDADLTRIGVELLDVDDRPTELFTCN